MRLRPIRSESDHETALLEIERLWGAPQGTPKADRLDVLLTLAEAYEQARHPIDLPDPIAAIRFRLEQMELDQQALIGVIGTRSRVSEVMQGRRGLSLAMIRRLHERFQIPAEVLIQSAAKPKRRRVA